MKKTRVENLVQLSPLMSFFMIFYDNDSVSLHKGDKFEIDQGNVGLFSVLSCIVFLLDPK
jgi:hypothetical protein